MLVTVDDGPFLSVMDVPSSDPSDGEVIISVDGESTQTSAARQVVLAQRLAEAGHTWESVDP